MKHPPVDQPAVEQIALPITVEGAPLAAPNTTEAGRVAREPQFKPYTMDQLFLPMDCGGMIPPHHVVRVVNDAVNRLSEAVFLDIYSGGGRPPYHPG